MTKIGPRRLGIGRFPLRARADLARAVELAAGRTDERASLAVLAVAGLLPDEHHARAAQALAEDRLRRVSPEVASVAVRGRGAQGVQRAFFGQERSGVVRFGLEHVFLLAATRNRKRFNPRSMFAAAG